MWVYVCYAKMFILCDALKVHLVEISMLFQTIFKRIAFQASGHALDCL